MLTRGTQQVQPVAFDTFYLDCMDRSFSKYRLIPQKQEANYDKCCDGNVIE